MTVVAETVTMKASITSIFIRVDMMITLLSLLKIKTLAFGTSNNP